MADPYGRTISRATLHRIPRAPRRERARLAHCRPHSTAAGDSSVLRVTFEVQQTAAVVLGGVALSQPYKVWAGRGGSSRRDVGGTPAVGALDGGTG
jgi:hypothetical protein